jgi:hypothetical protein
MQTAAHSMIAECILKTSVRERVKVNDIPKPECLTDCLAFLHTILCLKPYVVIIDQFSTK